MKKEFLKNVTIVYNIVTHKRLIVSTLCESTIPQVRQGICHNRGAKKLNNFYEPVFRGCAFPTDLNIAKGRKNSNHPQKLWSFGKNKKKRTGE